MQINLNRKDFYFGSNIPCSKLARQKYKYKRDVQAYKVDILKHEIVPIVYLVMFLILCFDFLNIQIIFVYYLFENVIPTIF